MKIPSLLPLVVTSALMAQQPADVIFVNGKIWTVDNARPEVEAVAVAGGRIIAVGSTKEIESYRIQATKVVDLMGRRMLPGFIDNHTHFMTGGFQLRNVDLRSAATQEVFTAIIKKRAEEKPGRWITGGDWDHENWKDAPLPTKELIDRYTPVTPVFVWRYDEHMALANSYTLKLAGITKESVDPPGGTIVRDPKTGEPTGILKDEAMSAVYRVMPDDAEEDRIAVARLALAEARKCGVTSVQDVSSGADVKTYRTLQRNGELTLRFHCRLPISQWEQVAAAGIEVPFGDEWIRIGSLKAFADGSLGSSTALFFEPFTSDPTTHGLASDIVLDGRLEKWALPADRARLQLSIHAIGDSANSLILDLFEKIVAQNPKWDRRFRIEHAQHIAAKDFDRFARLGVIASAQPYHAADDGRWAAKRIGQERCKTTYPFRTFLDHGVVLTFGSDWTVAPINPLLGIHAAVTRRTTDGKNPNGWIPEQKISVQEAIACYTINNAYAVFEESEKGSIRVGKLADFVVLNEDILTIDPARIDAVTVAQTVIGGKIVYDTSVLQ
ncbi:MAG: amidohydrolase [Ignavibacteriales bacterium]|nr:amidohydrolase [Ignavibacteriales bacterium]